MAESPGAVCKREGLPLLLFWDNPDFRKARLNPLRRIWQAPGEAFERALRPTFGLKYAFMTKYFIGKGMWTLAAVWSMAYYGLYCSGDWTTMGGWKHKISKPATMPYEVSYPKKNPRWERGEPWMYGAQGFDKNKVELKTSTTPYHS